MSSPPSEHPALALSRQWLEKAVIGLNLCPFAKAPHVKGQIRWVLSAATTPEALMAELVAELNHLANANPDEVETTLLVHPQVLGDFLDFNDFVHEAEEAVARLGLEGELQVASFHPQFQFGGTDADDISNYTNRSPYPTLHLIRESSIDRAVEAFPEAEDIYERNIETMASLGHEGWQRLFQTPESTP